MTAINKYEYDYIEIYIFGFDLIFVNLSWLCIELLFVFTIMSCTGRSGETMQYSVL